jgi:hypothetical protein
MEWNFEGCLFIPSAIEPWHKTASSCNSHDLSSMNLRSEDNLLQQSTPLWKALRGLLSAVMCRLRFTWSFGELDLGQSRLVDDQIHPAI